LGSHTISCHQDQDNQPHQPDTPVLALHIPVRIEGWVDLGKAELIKRWHYWSGSAHWHLGDVQLNNIFYDVCCFWQRVSIACYAERCLSYDRFCLTVRPSDRLSVTVRYHAKTTTATIMRSLLKDSPMILVSWLLTSARNSKGNIGSEGAEWERGRENVAKIGNFLPISHHISKTVRDRTIVTMTD